MKWTFINRPPSIPFSPDEMQENREVCMGVQFDLAKALMSFGT